LVETFMLTPSIRLGVYNPSRRIASTNIIAVVAQSSVVDE
jgi:hypothetical protein